jgi:tRNA pseudouridine38-40 synthase
MMRYFFHIGYNGNNYNGWQKLPQANSVQEVIERQLSQILKTPLTIVGCGRTDTQVHAGQFFFHVDIADPWDFDLLFRLNKSLPPDIAIFDILPMKGDAHARFDAFERTYDYFIHTYKHPFLNNLSSLYEFNGLDFLEMRKAIALLPSYNDYRSFCRTPDKQKTTTCNVSRAELFVDTSGQRIRFSITANRFLSGMIRILMNKLLDIGKREMSVDEFEYLLITKKTPITILPAYPQGLYLSKVNYPFLDIPTRSNFLEFVLDAPEWKSVE